MSIKDFICSAMELETCNILAFDLPKNIEKTLTENKKRYPDPKHQADKTNNTH